MWHDGFITNIGNRITITTNKSTSVLIISKGGPVFRSIKKPISYELTDFPSEIFIIADSEGFSHDENSHANTISAVEKRYLEFGSKLEEDYDFSQMDSAYIEIVPLSGLSSGNPVGESSHDSITSVSNLDTLAEIAVQKEAEKENEIVVPTESETLQTENSLNNTQDERLHKYRFGALVNYKKNTVPFIYIWNGFKTGVINSRTGRFQGAEDSDVELLPEQTLKYDPKKDYKYIYPGAYIWYHSKRNNLLYRCIYGKVGTYGIKRNAFCEDLGEVNGTKWCDIYPEDAFNYIKHIPLFKHDGTFAEVRKALVGTEIQFYAGAQLKFNNEEIPYIFLDNSSYGRKLVLCSSTGAIKTLDQIKLTLMPPGESIPMKTKMIAEKGYKYIIKGSSVLYLHPDDDLFYPCYVTAFNDFPNIHPKVSCMKLGIFAAEWEKLFPIEAYSLVKHKAAKVHGFEDGEEVTVDKLRTMIKPLETKTSSHTEVVFEPIYTHVK